MINAVNNFNNINMLMLRSQERIATGKRINSAADDAAGLGFCDRMTAQINGMNQAYKNASSGIAELQVRDSNLATAVNILQTAREKVVSLGDGSLSAEDTAAIKKEITDLQTEYTKIVDTAAGAGAYDEITFQIGANSGDTLTVAKVDVAGGNAKAETAFASGTPTTATIDAAIKAIDDSRATYGSGINRLKSTMESLSKNVGNYETARSTVMDADVAAETANLAKYQLQQQGAMYAMMAKRQNDAMVLRLLQ